MSSQRHNTRVSIVVTIILMIEEAIIATVPLLDIVVGTVVVLWAVAFLVEICTAECISGL